MADLTQLPPSVFSHDALAAAIDRELAQLEVPAGKRGVLVGYYTQRGTWRVTALYRIGDNWDIGAVLGRDMATGNIRDGIEGGVKVRGTW